MTHLDICKHCAEFVANLERSKILILRPIHFTKKMLGLMVTCAVIATISAGDPSSSDSSVQKDWKSITDQLKAPRVRMKHPANVELMIKKIINGGPHNLQLIADFDLTLTKQHVDGKRQRSSYSYFNRCEGIPQRVIDGNKALVDEFCPILNDPLMSKTEKMPAIVKWSKATSALYSGFEFSPKAIREFVESSGIQLRDGTSELVSLMKAEGIPLLVYSAGLGDMVKAILEHHNVLHSNIHIISNFLKFKGGIVDGFQNEGIHPLNKNAQSASRMPYFKEMETRRNVVVLGDSVGDDEMANGLPNSDVVLKIGFIWDKEQLISTFMDHFDIVLVDDQTMNLPKSIVEACVSNSKNSGTYSCPCL